MRKITSLVATMLLSVATFAQAPQGFSYQAVVRDAQNAIVANQTVEVTISILQGATADAAKAVFSEKHSAQTNANGLFTITIGSVNASDFAKIDWGKGSCFLKTESAYGESITQLMSVPYALYAANAGTVDNATIEQFVSNIDFTTYNLVNKSTLANYATTENVNNALANYTTETKLKDTLAVYAKLADIPAETNLSAYATTENVNTTINTALADYTTTADLATVATTGSYNDLTNRPTIPTVPTNVGAFTNNVGYLVASDVTGKADKSEMSITTGSGTATIQLKNGTSATVLTQHQSIANNSTIQQLQQQIAALQTALAQVYTVNVKVKVTYHNPTATKSSAPYPQRYTDMSELITHNTLTVEGHSFTSQTSEHTFSIPIYQNGLEWGFNFTYTPSEGFCTIKVNGVQLTLDDSPLKNGGEIVLRQRVTNNNYDYIAVTQTRTSSSTTVGYFKDYELSKTSTKPNALTARPSGFTNDNILFRFYSNRNSSGVFYDSYEYKPIPAQMLFSGGKDNVVEIDVYAWYYNAN